MTFIVVDYSKGNLRSVQKGLELAGAQALISSDAADIQRAQAIVLPGVGSFADASTFMLASGQMQAIQERVAAGVPFFGICLGMQLLFECGSEGAPEGTWAQGLGILPGRCIRIANIDVEGRKYKVPHVGWNQVSYATNAKNNVSSSAELNTELDSESSTDSNLEFNAGHDAKLSTQRNAELDALFAGVGEGSHFYFTHSYGCEPASAKDVLAQTTHAQSIVSVVGRKHVFGVQFHPEKSSAKGLAVMENFVRFAKARYL